MPKPLIVSENQMELNEQVWCTLAPSKIHGVGVHAIRDIPKGQKLYLRDKGQKIYTSLDKLLPEIRAIIVGRWPLSLAGGQYPSPNSDAWMVSFINHSEESNYDLATDTALKDIKKDEEILEDYKLCPTYKEAFPWLDQPTTLQNS